jgi:small-conductance mechanosensitive channel
MEKITSIVSVVLNNFNLDGTKVLFGNSISLYVSSLLVFAMWLIVFAILQYFAIAWLTTFSRRTKTDLDDAFVKMVNSFRPPFYIFISFWFAVRYLNVHGFFEKIITAIIVIWFIYQIVVIVGILVEDVIFKHIIKNHDETTKSAIHIISSIVKATVWIFGIILVLSNFGIDVTSLLAGAGIAGVAIAFALQGILSDLFSSFSIYFDKPFKIGDYIKTGGNVNGVVKQIGIKSTRIEARDGEEIVISNQELTGAKIQNFELMKERPTVFSFGVLYETNYEKLQSIPKMVKEIIESQDMVRFDRAHFKSFGESSLDFEVVYFVLDQDYTLYMDIQQKINFALFKRFEEEGIGFAYPTRTIYMSQHDS